MRRGGSFWFALKWKSWWLVTRLIDSDMAGSEKDRQATVQAEDGDDEPDEW